MTYQPALVSFKGCTNVSVTDYIFVRALYAMTFSDCKKVNIDGTETMVRDWYATGISLSGCKGVNLKDLFVEVGGVPTRFRPITNLW